METATGRRSVVGKDVYVGIDVHKESRQVTVRIEGEEIFNGRIPGQYQSLRKLFERHQGCRMKVAYEAGPFGFWLSDKLVEGANAPGQDHEVRQQ